ncbi:hypothetical protein ABK040_015178 [Willaertia magna]
MTELQENTTNKILLNDNNNENKHRASSTIMNNSDKKLMVDDEEEEEMLHLESDALMSSTNNNNKNTRLKNNNKKGEKELMPLNIYFPSYYFKIAKHILIFISLFIIFGFLSGFAFREITKHSVPYQKVGDYVYQQGSLIHGHFFTLGVFLPLTFLCTLFFSYLITGVKVSNGLYHTGFLIYAFGATLTLILFVYKAVSFINAIKQSPNINIHELELIAFGSTSSYNGDQKSGSALSRMTKMLLFGGAHVLMFIGGLKCVIIVLISLFKKSKSL